MATPVAGRAACRITGVSRRERSTSNDIPVRIGNVDPAYIKPESPWQSGLVENFLQWLTATETSSKACQNVCRSTSRDKPPSFACDPDLRRSQCVQVAAGRCTPLGSDHAGTAAQFNLPKVHSRRLSSSLTILPDGRRGERFHCDKPSST